MADSTVEKTIDPTAYRRAEVRRQGRVALSHDLASTIALVLALLLLAALGKGVLEFVAAFMQQQLGQTGALVSDQTELVTQLQGLMRHTAEVLLPLVGLVSLAAAGGNVLQVGFLFTPSRIQPDLGRLNPVQGIQRIVSLRGTARFGFNLIKLAAVGGVGGMILWKRWEEILGASALEIGPLAQFIANIVIQSALWVGVVLLGIAILDYGFQRWKHEQDLKLTPQELREEQKLLEGDQAVKQRQREMARENRIPPLP